MGFATDLNKYLAAKSHFTHRKKEKLSGTQMYSTLSRTELVCFIGSSLVSSTVTSNRTVEFVIQRFKQSSDSARLLCSVSADEKANTVSVF